MKGTREVFKLVAYFVAIPLVVVVFATIPAPGVDTEILKELGLQRRGIGLAVVYLVRGLVFCFCCFLALRAASLGARVYRTYQS